MNSLKEQFLLRPDMVFLNHGSFGACPRPVFAAWQAWQLEMERQPLEFLGLERRYSERLGLARRDLAADLHATPDDLVFVPNATTGINIVARSLDLQPGDEILATDHEYGALDRTWTFLCRKTGALYRRHPIPVPVTTHADFVEQLWSGVTPRTRVIYLSHITSATALVFPVAEICRRARQAGILSIVDGAHAPGQIPLDLEAIGADAYVGNLHKWQMNPKGSAFLHVRPALQPRIEPLVVSWGWESDQPGPSRFQDEQGWQGTRDISAFLSIPAALAFCREHRWDEVRIRCRETLRFGRRLLQERFGLQPLCPDSPEWFVQMSSFFLPEGSRPPAELNRRLWDRHRIECWTSTWNGRGLLRLSIQGYNDEADLKRLADALELELPATPPGGPR